MGDVLGLNGGVDRDPAQVGELQRACRVGDLEALLQERLELIPDALAPVAEAFST